jgi:hypothetical protein
MNGEGVQAIAALTRKPVELGGYLFRPNDWSVEDPASLVKSGPLAKTFGVATLGAIRDYIKANRDALDLSTLVVHVVSPSSVQLLGPLDPRTRAREAYVQATATDLTDGFLGHFHSLEHLIVGLQVRFADADDRQRILALLSNVKHETVKSSADDGVTQTVQARAGVVLVSEVAVPNPVLLTPYRTFRDIVQPSSLFVLRVQQGRNGGLPEAGLFEADGGAWRLTSVERIREWLTGALGQDVAVLA